MDAVWIAEGFSTFKGWLFVVHAFFFDGRLAHTLWISGWQDRSGYFCACWQCFGFNLDIMRTLVAGRIWYKRHRTSSLFFLFCSEMSSLTRLDWSQDHIKTHIVQTFTSHHIYMYASICVSHKNVSDDGTNRADLLFFSKMFALLAEPFRALGPPQGCNPSSQGWESSWRRGMIMIHLNVVAPVTREAIFQLYSKLLYTSGLKLTFIHFRNSSLECVDIKLHLENGEEIPPSL